MLVTKTFKFDNRPQNITGFIHHFLDDLTALLLQFHHNGDLLFKVKVIVSELLNNAVKHSGTRQTLIDVHLDGRALFVTKKDDGQPIDLFNNIEAESSPYIICADDMNLLYAVKQSNTLTFYCEESGVESIDVNRLVEHMGLLIITKAANEFTYKYQNQYNVFSVKLNLV